jgi:probable F420-dependent oxidoreductase
MALQLGTFGAWFNPVYDDSTRIEFVVEAEALGYTAAWLGLGQSAVADLSLVERALDATTTIIVATAIVNIWTNDATTVARSYQRIAAKHPDRFLLGVGVGHPESIATYRSPLETMTAYLDVLDAGGVPRDRRVLAALGPRALRMAAERAAGAHPYLVVPEFIATMSTTCSAMASLPKTSPMVAATGSSMRSCSTAHPNASRPGSPRTSTPAPTT